MGARRTGFEKRSFARSTFINIFYSSRKHKDVPRSKAAFLVVKYEEGCRGVRFKMLDVSTSEDRTPETQGRVESVNSS